MKTILYLLFISLLPISIFAQSTTIKGRIVNKKSQKGVPFTNIGIAETYLGTASDQEGYFELKIPSAQKDGQLTISAVGYQTKTLQIKTFINDNFLRVSLSPKTYSIKNIDIEAKSRVLLRILKTASKKIQSNYLNGSSGMRIHYYESLKADTLVPRIREAIADIYDADSYSQPSITDAFQNRRFKFVEVNKNFDSYSFPDGATGLQELLEMDIVRTRSTLMNPDLLSDYDLELEGSAQYGKDSVWVIDYQMKNPDLVHSGDYYPTKLEGKLFINKSDYAIVRHVCLITASKNSPENRSLYTKLNVEKAIQYQFVCNYHKQNGKYMINYIECQKSFKNSQGQSVNYIRKAGVLQVDLSPEPIGTNNYFENVTYHKEFWKRFHNR